eukprot:scaffold13700_cov252-Ochromonas_danica.AAC.11
MVGTCCAVAVPSLDSICMSEARTSMSVAPESAMIPRRGGGSAAFSSVVEEEWVVVAGSRARRLQERVTTQR